MSARRRALLAPIDFGVHGAGLGRTTAALARSLQRRSFAVDVYSARPPDLEGVRELYGVEVGPLRHVAPRPDLARGGAVARALRHLHFVLLSGGYDLLWMQSPGIPFQSRARRAWLFAEFPRPPAGAFCWRARLRSYDRILANSGYTASWVHRRWGLEADVFYPSVAVTEPSPDPGRTILSVGRFTGARRSKNQLLLVDAFRRVHRRAPEWTLVLAGLVDSPDYLRSVRDAASGLPVRILERPSAAELLQLYREASLFWHAAGYGLDAASEPQNMEHFGIVVAEAMSAGCIPLVFDGGGPVEIVGDRSLVWRDPDELVTATLQQILDPASERRRQRLARSCRDRFDDVAFEARIDRLLEGGGS